MTKAPTYMAILRVQYPSGDEFLLEATGNLAFGSTDGAYSLAVEVRGREGKKTFVVLEPRARVTTLEGVVLFDGRSQARPSNWDKRFEQGLSEARESSAKRN